MSSNDLAVAHQAADYAVKVRQQDGATVSDVLRDGAVVWTSPYAASEGRARQLAAEHIGALCGLRDAPRR